MGITFGLCPPPGGTPGASPARKSCLAEHPPRHPRRSFLFHPETGTRRDGACIHFAPGGCPTVRPVISVIAVRTGAGVIDGVAIRDMLMMAHTDAPSSTSSGRAV